MNKPYRIVSRQEDFISSLIIAICLAVVFYAAVLDANSGI